jgi:flagellin
MEQLSTGSKINSASDDAAGLAMASKFTSQIKGLDMAVKNANDGVSMISTAEGALNEVTNMLQRMRELAVQSSNGTMTSDDRSYMDKEYQALDAEIDRIENNTTWNGVKILSGNAGQGASGSETATVNFQVSSNFTAGSTTAGFTHNSVIGTAKHAAVAHNDIIGKTKTEVEAATGKTVTASTIAAGAAGAFAVGDKITFAEYNSGGETTLAAGSTIAAVNYAAGDSYTATGHSAVTLSAGATQAAITVASNDVIAVDFGDLGTDTASLSNVTSQANAQAAIATLDGAIKNVNEQRATFGASSNRLVHAVDNMSNVKVNAEASRSRIEDTDYAKTTSELAKAQIIAQAGTAMLAQANQSSQSVLSLLR